MIPKVDQWVTDTTMYTHFWRAGHADILGKLAPGGIVWVPAEVNEEIEKGRQTYPGISSVASCEWAKIAILDGDSLMMRMAIQADLGADTSQAHIGESAAIAFAFYNNLVALVDDWAAGEQADLRDVRHRNTGWVLREAHRKLPMYRDRGQIDRVIKGLHETDMKLPSAETIFAELLSDEDLI